MGNCQRRSRPSLLGESSLKPIQAQPKQEQSPPEVVRCEKHKLPEIYICVDEKCEQRYSSLCTRCYHATHSSHEIQEISSLHEQVKEKCDALHSLAASIQQNKRPSYQKKQRIFEHGSQFHLSNDNSQLFQNTLDDSLLLKLQRTTKQMHIKQHKELLSHEDKLLNVLRNPENFTSEIQKELIEYYFSPTYTEMMDYHTFKNSQMISAMMQQLNPYRFNYANFKNTLSSTLCIQTQSETMKLRTCCRIDSRYTAVHFRNSAKHSEFYIIDLIKESIIFSSKHPPQTNNQQEVPIANPAGGDLNLFLYKISSLGEYYICFNYVRYVIIENFKELIQRNNSSRFSNKSESLSLQSTIASQIHRSTSSDLFNSTKSLIQLIWDFKDSPCQQQNGISAQSNNETQIDETETKKRQMNSIKIVSQLLIFTVDSLQSGKLCLMEKQKYEEDTDSREYTIWNFLKKQCLRTLNVQGDKLYDIFSRFLVLDSNYDSFSLFNWQTNSIEKTYKTLLPFLSGYFTKTNSALYNLQAVKVFAIQKLLTTRDDSFLKAYPSFEEWLQSLPFEYKQMVIFEDSWLFKHDKTSIIMISDCILIYDMNLNKVIKKIPLKLKEQDITFIWQAGDKVVYVTKDGSFHFYQ